MHLIPLQFEMHVLGHSSAWKLLLSHQHESFCVTQHFPQCKKNRSFPIILQSKIGTAPKEKYSAKPEAHKTAMLSWNTLKQLPATVNWSSMDQQGN